LEAFQKLIAQNECVEDDECNIDSRNKAKKTVAPCIVISEFTSFIFN